MSYRKASTAFVLTPWEEQLLEAVRCGFTTKEIKYLLDMSPRSNAYVAISVAIDKERLILLAQQDKRRPGIMTRLDVARGQKRSIVDVHKGRWKTG